MKFVCLLIVWVLSGCGNSNDEGVIATPDVGQHDGSGDAEGASFCEGQLDATLCDDGNACTVGERCANKFCVGGDPLACESELACTASSCDPNAGCVETDAPDDSECSLACFESARCQSGECAGEPETAIAVDDGNPCTMDLCENGEAVHSAADGGSCQVANACQSLGTCVASVCVSALPCDCAQDVDCVPPENLCDGQMICLKRDSGAECILKSDSAVQCGASVSPCTKEQCNPKTGACDVLPVLGASCDDGNACTLDDLCDGNGCQGGPDQVCDDDDACNGVELCDAIVGCVDGVAPLCDDEILCTVDVCEPAVGCVNTPIVNGTACGDDGIYWCQDKACVDPLADCKESLLAAPAWFEDANVDEWKGAFEFGQTHVAWENDDRIHPNTMQGRETLLLFTPEDAIDGLSDVRVTVTLGEETLGTLKVAPPSQLPQSLEEHYSKASLDPYSADTWSAFLPWNWVQEGVTVTIAHSMEGVIYQHSFELKDLAPAHILTHSRSKMLLFGDGTKGTATTAATQFAQDLHASTPAAVLRLVDSTPWVIPYVVVRTADGPKRVYSEGERTSVTSDPDRWHILKHQHSKRMDLANTGRGLYDLGGGDSSPYSYGTSIAMGWVKNDDGSYSDANNAPYAAGWTGWSAFWLGECGNMGIHELGHTMTLGHFTGGTAINWNIDAEYPNDGTNLAAHPWGFDTTRRLFRTWYRVNTDGPVMADGALVGKRDPMNGGEAKNAITCYPQYTAYHSRKALNWMQNNSTFRVEEGLPGLYKWNKETHGYDKQETAAKYQKVLAVDVPVVTLIGTLSKNQSEEATFANQTYPPIYWALGNAFELPDPATPGLHEDFDDAQYFLEIHYADMPSKRALMRMKEITDTSMGLYSVNLPLSDKPTKVDLYVSESGYPNIDFETAMLLDTREIPEAPSLPDVVVAGREFVANGAMGLTQWCTSGIDCQNRQQQSLWRVSDEPLRFSVVGDEAPVPVYCSQDGSYTTLEIPVVKDGAEDVILVVHAQRVISNGDGTVAVPLDDNTAWSSTADTIQGIKVWIPYELNSALAPGSYAGVAHLNIWKGDAAFGTTKLTINLTVHELMDVALNPTYETPSYTTSENTSSYFIVSDPSMGPTSPKWWNGGAKHLYAPVIDQDDDSLHTLKIRAWKIGCGTWDFNTGQGVDVCETYAKLTVEDGANDWLVPGHTYITPGSSPLVIIHNGWHQKSTFATYPLKLHYTAP